MWILTTKWLASLFPIPPDEGGGVGKGSGNEDVSRVGGEEGGEGVRRGKIVPLCDRSIERSVCRLPFIKVLLETYYL